MIASVWSESRIDGQAPAAPWAAGSLAKAGQDKLEGIWVGSGWIQPGVQELSAGTDDREEPKGFLRASG